MIDTEREKYVVDRKLLGILAAALALVLLLALTFLWLEYRASSGQSGLEVIGRLAVTLLPPPARALLGQQARLMGLPLATDSHAYWYLARAGGVVAYILLWLATVWGIMMSSKVIKGVVSVPVAFAMHEYLPILGVVFAALHALVLLGDTYIDFTLWQLLVPFAGPYKPLWTGLGILAFYLSLALIVSFYFRKRIGQKAWRAFHYTAYLAFLIALVHGMMAGSDSGSAAMRALYLVTGGTSVFLVLYRLLAYAPRPQRVANRH